MILVAGLLLQAGCRSSESTGRAAQQGSADPAPRRKPERQAVSHGPDDPGRGTKVAAAPSAEPGTSFETAIRIGDKVAGEAVRSERQFLDKHYPGSVIYRQRLRGHGGKRYDVLELKLPDGGEKTLYFEIGRPTVR